MNSDEQQEILRQIAELRRESRVRHRWVIFIALCVGLPLFAPQVAAFIAHLIEYGGEYLAPLIALVVVMIVAAAIVSRSAARGEPRDG
jgi:uncharacterized membrane protein